MQKTADIDVQLEVSHWLEPNRNVKELDQRSENHPVMCVFLAIIAGGLFDAPIFPIVTVSSYEKDSVMLPVRNPRDTKTLVEPKKIVDRPILHTIELTDSHCVASHTLIPDRAIAVNVMSTRPAPFTVINADPVPALLIRPSTLVDPTSTEYVSVLLPDRSTDVTVTPLEPPAPYPV